MPQSPDPRKQQRRRLIVSIILASVAVHVLAALGAGIWVVARYFAPTPAVFEVKKDLRIPAKEREHRMNMAEFDALTPKPALQDKLASIRPAAFALPDLPKVPFDQMLPMDPAEMVSDQVASLVGAAGAGAGGTGAGGVGGKGGGFSFFGIQSTGRRVLLVFDISTSVMNKAAKAGISPDKLKGETLALIDKFGINTRFGMVQMSQNYQPFQPELLPATDQNKASARAWIAREWVDTGLLPASKKSVVSNPRGLLGVLEFGFQLDPDVVFLISDGSFQWRPEGKIGNIPYKDIRDFLRDDAKKRGRQIPLNLVGFEMKTEDRNEWRRIARGSGGTIRELD